MLQYRLHVSGAEYARYHFALREMMMRSDGPPGRNDVGPGISSLSALSGFTCTPGAGTSSGVAVLRQRVVIPELKNG